MAKLTRITSNKTFTDKYGVDADEVVFGNAKNPNDFEACIEMKFFNNEDFITLREVDAEGTPIKGVPTFANEKITLDLPKRTLEWYKTDSRRGRGSGTDLHIVEILKEKPKTNKGG